MIKEQFDKNMTNIIKGIMVICMFILHFFTMLEEYVRGSYPNLVEFSIFWNKPLNICVLVFVF
ncbi:hypothetical protein DW667_03335 [Coprococcus sp. AM25-15LB]|nr:hypothetical protein DW667_03335 [Coprococcus sp. AM25-15LB]RJW09821.1 hypothetical protein DW686_03335 [Coprococcus sp. AM25-4LB]